MSAINNLQAHRASAVRAFLKRLENTNKLVSDKQLGELLTDTEYRQYRKDVDHLLEERRIAQDVASQLTGNAATYWDRLNDLRMRFPRQRSGKAILSVRKQNERFKVYDDAVELAEFFKTQLTAEERDFFREPNVTSKRYDSILRLDANLMDLRDGLENLPHLQNVYEYAQRDALVQALNSLNSMQTAEVPLERLEQGARLRRLLER